MQLVRRSALEDGGEDGRAFFHAEYRLNHLMFTYPKPIVAFMDGVTMGGGVGISQPAKYPRRDREHALRHARGRDRAVPRRRRGLVPAAAARPHGCVPRAHRRAAGWRGMPVGRTRDALSAERTTCRSQGADHCRARRRRRDPRRARGAPARAAHCRQCRTHRSPVRLGQLSKKLSPRWRPTVRTGR